jgi:uncharacterized protein (TIGR03382 family)
VEYGGGPGRGLAQWSVGGRWDTDSGDNATWYAGTEGMSVWSLDLQLDFIWYELSTFPSYGLASLQAATNVTDATIAFQNDFEGCGTCDQAQRIAYAMAVLAAFGSTTVDAGPPAPDAGVPCVETMTGATGVCMDTAECAGLGGTSTPDYCPGPANVQCCTGFDAGSPAAPDAASPDAATHDAASPDAGTHDAGTDAAKRPPGSPPQTHDASSSGDFGVTRDQGGGCSTSPGVGDSAGSTWLLGLALTVLRLRRRRDPHARATYERRP